MSALVASKIRRPSSPSMATSAKSHRSGDWRAAVSRASNCRWVKPSVGDSGAQPRGGRAQGWVPHDAVDDAGFVEPGRDGEAPRDGGGLEPADLLHPPDIQLQVHAASGQRVQAAFGASGKEAAQVRLGVLTRGALETGQVGSHCQPQLISERHQTIRWDGRKVGESHHAQTLRPLHATPKSPRTSQARQLRTCTRSAAGNYALLRALP